MRFGTRTFEQITRERLFLLDQRIGYAMQANMRTYATVGNIPWRIHE